jgi:UDP-glucuronate 4-epimerase
MTRRALVTGSAGFIGFHLVRRLLAGGWQVTGLDAMTPYYDPALKSARLAQLDHAGFRQVTGDIAVPGLVAGLLAQGAGADAVFHLAAQAGVRYSLDAPASYVDANVTGTFQVLEACRAHPPRHLMFASTSSVYGADPVMPYAESARADHPVSLYAATKKAGEAMAHAYAHLFGFPVTAFRFFTVYGPWGRPDMAYFKFTRAILQGDPIEVYNHGDMRRDFTYVDDLVDGILRLADLPPAAGGDGASPVAPFRVVNIGHGAPLGLMTFIAAIEAACGRPAVKHLLPMQPGDVPATWADAALLHRLTGPLPVTPLDQGMARFVDWYRGWTGANGPPA